MRSADSEYQCVAGHKASCSKSETQTQGRDDGAATQLNSQTKKERSVFGLARFFWVTFSCIYTSYKVCGHRKIKLYALIFCYNSVTGRLSAKFWNLTAGSCSYLITRATLMSVGKAGKTISLSHKDTVVLKKRRAVTKLLPQSRKKTIV